MPYILEAWAPTEQMPRIAWLEATGRGDEVRVTFANSLGILAEGLAHAEELEAFANGGGDCICSANLWIERTEVPHMWSVSVVQSPDAGQFRISSYDLTCGLHQIQLDRILTSAGADFSAVAEPARTVGFGTFNSLQMSRGTVYNG